MKEEIAELFASHYCNHAHMSYHIRSEEYKAVIAMGEEAIGPLFEILQETPKSVHFVIHALPEITGQHPPGWDDYYQGKMLAIRELYLQWGVEQGYITPIERTSLSKDDILFSNEVLENLISFGKICLEQGNYKEALSHIVKELKKMQG
jgi:hypothetical protein